MITALHFESVIGHKRQIDYLQRVHVSAKAAHGYLFYGVSHLGKRKVAELFAAELLRASDGQKNNLLTHPDFFLLELGINEKTGKQKKNIGIDEVRGLIHKLSLSSACGGAKVAIIDDAHTMSAEAANALLKTLEEPTYSSHIILIANSLDALPKTVVSRLQILRFSAVRSEVIEEGLLKLGVDEEKAREISILAFGSPGAAISKLVEEDALQNYRTELRNDLDLISASLVSRFKSVEKLVPEKASDARGRALRVLDRWESIFRELLLISFTARGSVAYEFIGDQLRKAGSLYSPRELILQIKNLAQTRAAIAENVSPRFALEHFLLNL